MSDQKLIITNSKLPTILGFLSIVVIIGLIVVGYFAYKSITEENQKLRNEIVEFKQLTESLVRSSTKWATKKDLEEDLQNFMTKDDLNVLKDDLKKLDSRLTAVGMTVGVVSRKVSKLEASDRQGEEKPPQKVCEETDEPIDVHKYTQKVQVKKLEDSNTAPVGEVEFDASKNKPWKYQLFEKEYKLTTVVGEKDSGQLTFHHQLQYSVPSQEPDKTYPINITASAYRQVPKTSKWFWLNPRLDANFFIGGRVYKFTDGFGRSDNILSMGVDLGLSLSSYGETKIDSWFRLFRFGLGYDIERQAGHLSFSPFSFNVGKPLPLLTNLYLSPQVAVDTGGGLKVVLGIGPQF